MEKNDRERLLEAVAVTAEMTATELSKAAARMFANDLAVYPVDQVLGALTRCRRELKGRLTLASVIERLDDGRPGVEEAWAMLPMNEDVTVVWTDEMVQAWGIAAPLLTDGDRITARMAFKEKYTQLVQEARTERKPVKWTPSLGRDARGREAALTEAVRLGRLGASHVAGLLPDFSPPHSSVFELQQSIKAYYALQIADKLAK